MVSDPTSSTPNKHATFAEMLGGLFGIGVVLLVGPAIIAFLFSVIGGQSPTLDLFIRKLDVAAGRTLVCILFTAAALPVSNRALSKNPNSAVIPIISGLVAFAVVNLFICPILFGKYIAFTDFLFYRDDYFFSAAYSNMSAFIVSHGVDGTIAGILTFIFEAASVYTAIDGFLNMLGLFREKS